MTLQTKQNNVYALYINDLFLSVKFIIDLILYHFHIIIIKTSLGFVL